MKPEQPKVVGMQPQHTRAKTALGVQKIVVGFCFALFCFVEFVDEPCLHSKRMFAPEKTHVNINPLPRTKVRTYLLH